MVFKKVFVGFPHSFLGLSRDFLGFWGGWGFDGGSGADWGILIILRLKR